MKDARLGRLADGLTALERATLVLRSWKEGREEDLSWRATMPHSQLHEFNRLIALMNGVNVQLFPFLLVVILELEKLSLREALLATLSLWGYHVINLKDALEYEGVELPKHAGSSLFEHSPMVPVVYISEAFQDLVKKEAPEPNKVDETASDIKDLLRDAIPAQWHALRAAEIVIDEVRDAFGGEDPKTPDVGRLLACATERVADVKKGAEMYTGPIELGEPDEELVARVRRMVEGA